MRVRYFGSNLNNIWLKKRKETTHELSLRMKTIMNTNFMLESIHVKLLDTFSNIQINPNQLHKVLSTSYFISNILKDKDLVLSMN